MRITLYVTNSHRFLSPIRVSVSGPDFPRSTSLLASISTTLGRTMADDMDMMAMMGITGFGKQSKKRELDPNRFDKNRREVRGPVRLLRVAVDHVRSLG